MVSQISVVINTLNSQDNIKRAIESVKWADEILVCDMYSDDKTVEIAKKLGARIVFHKRLDYVEPARNFAIGKAKNDWVIILDPDEEVSSKLKERLVEIATKTKQIDYVRISRKNLIFGKWVQASLWWPDYNIRFFRKGKVKWTNQIHRPPQTIGEGLDLPAEERLSIIHHHYKTVPQFLDRMIRYTKIQAEQLNKENYVFDWHDLIKKPLGEFLSRFFANKGYLDGIHGLVLALLQAFSQLVLYLHLWEMSGFKAENLELEELEIIKKKSAREIDYWFKYGNLSQNPFKRFIQKIGNKV